MNTWEKMPWDSLKSYADTLEHLCKGMPCDNEELLAIYRETASPEAVFHIYDQLSSEGLLSDEVTWAQFRAEVNAVRLSLRIEEEMAVETSQVRQAEFEMC